MSDTPLSDGISVIKNYLEQLPDAPGVYRMLSADDSVLYVGKAKSLKKRVVSYTRPEALPIRMQRMVALTKKMAFVITDREHEALLLESNLIKQLKPKYNILLRDDKAYPCIFISKEHPFPQLVKHRGARTAKGYYFGPFGSADSVNQTIDALQKAFLLRSCSDNDFSHRSRPCLQYQIKRCTAPCVGLVSQSDYKNQVTDVIDFLRGKSSVIQQKLSEKMFISSENKDYETAMLYRDRIRALSNIQMHQNINTSSLGDADVIAMVRGGNLVCVQIFFFRGGSHYGNRVFFPKHGDDCNDAAIMQAFLSQFYLSMPPPDKIVVSVMPDEVDVLQKMLSVAADTAVQIINPKRGDVAEIMASCVMNANSALAREISDRENNQDVLKRLQQVFDLENFVRRIECYDNSHLQGSYATGAMVVVTENGFEKSAYRTYKMSIAELDTRDDYAMMRKMLQRRLAGASDLPDLMLIDGGLGQLNIAAQVLQEYNLNIPLVAIAKGIERNAGRETFYRINHQPMTLDARDPALYDLQRIRDEVHRLAITTHRKKRDKSIKDSAIESVSGVGAVRKKALLSHFGSVAGIKNASLKDLERVPNIDKELAKRIFDYFH